MALSDSLVFCYKFQYKVIRRIYCLELVLQGLSFAVRICDGGKTVLISACSFIIVKGVTPMIYK